MPVAEKLRAEGRVEGRVEGRMEGRVEGLAEGNWIGKIQTLEEFLEKTISPNEILEALTLPELEASHAALHREYEIRFKRG